MMAQELDNANRNVYIAKVHLRWCIESGELECGLRVAREGLTTADREFHQAISKATITQREAFIIANHVDPEFL